MADNAIFCGHLGLGDHVVLQGAVNLLAPKYKGKFIIPCKPHSEINIKVMVEQCLDKYDLSRVIVYPLPSESSKLSVVKNKHIEGKDVLPSWRDDRVHFYDDRCRELRKKFLSNELDICLEGGDAINCGVMDQHRWHKMYRKWSSPYRCKSSKFFCRLFYKQLGIPDMETWNWQPRPGKLADEVTEKLKPNCPYVFVHDDPTRGFMIKDEMLPRGLKIVRASDCYGHSIFDYIPLMEGAETCHFIDSSVALLWDRCEGRTKTDNFVHRYVRPDCTKPYYDKRYWRYYGGPVHRFRGRKRICSEKELV